MAFKDFPRHTQGVQLLQRSLERGRLAHGYLFSGHYLEELEAIAKQYGDLGLNMRAANMDRVCGWSLISQRLGDPDAGIKPSLFIHKRCQRLLQCLPYVQHDPDRPGDVLKININEEGMGGDDSADALRYMVATEAQRIYVRKLTGW